MSVIRYGELNVEIASSHGAVITRLTQQQAPVDSFSPRHAEASQSLPVPGREQQVADALRAIEQGRPVEFHAGCGYGKTALLQHVAANAAERHPAFSCVYLRADGDRVEDLLQELVTEVYRSEQPVKLTPAECGQLLRQVSLVVAVDDAPADPAQVGYLLDVLPGCRFVLGCDTRIAVRGGSSHDLPGLPADAALALLAADLGRALTSHELPVARNLAAAVGGQPLHLKQAAALVREGSHSLASLAWQAADDPAVLDRLSISSLTDRERRALAVLAFAAGALLPSTSRLWTSSARAAQLGECLTALRRKGLAEQRRDRFGLPVCKAASYRTMLLGDLQLGAAAGALTSWLAVRHPSASESQSAAEAVLAILEFAAERQEWDTAVQLARIAEQIVFIAGRWEAWHHVLGQGLAAANATQASAVQAFFCHQLGSLELCLGRFDDAARLLQHALAVRERIGDLQGADLTRQNLQLLGLSPPPPAAPAGIRATPATTPASSRPRRARTGHRAEYARADRRGGRHRGRPAAQRTYPGPPHPGLLYPPPAVHRQFQPGRPGDGAKCHRAGRDPGGEPSAGRRPDRDHHDHQQLRHGQGRHSAQPESGRRGRRPQGHQRRPQRVQLATAAARDGDRAGRGWAERTDRHNCLASRRPGRDHHDDQQLRHGRPWQRAQPEAGRRGRRPQGHQRHDQRVQRARAGDRTERRGHHSAERHNCPASRRPGRYHHDHQQLRHVRCNGTVVTQDPAANTTVSRAGVTIAVCDTTVFPVS